MAMASEVPVEVVPSSNDNARSLSAANPSTAEGPIVGPVSINAWPPSDGDLLHEVRTWCRGLWGICTLFVHRALGTNGERRLELRYPLRFKLLAMVTFVISTWWVLNFFIAVLPTAVDRLEGPCRLTDDQLRQNSIVLFGYFLCFAIVRVCIFLPGVAARVAEILLGLEGPWRLYALRMILHGPLYIFGIGSVLFAFQLVLSPTCAEQDHWDPSLHSTFRQYAIYSCLVFTSCSSLAMLHSSFITQAGRRQAIDKRRAPPGTLDKLLTLTYDPELFGDEDEKMYPGECPICLQDWEDEDVIKVTPCRHAFHADCIGHWLMTERTCAFCRQDVTATPLPRSPIGASSANRQSSVAPLPPSSTVVSVTTVGPEPDQDIPGTLGVDSAAVSGTDEPRAEIENEHELSVEVLDASAEAPVDTFVLPAETSRSGSSNVSTFPGQHLQTRVLDP